FGVALEGRAKNGYTDISARISQLSSSFSNHVLDATQAYFRTLNEDELAGLSASHIELLKQYGKQHELDQPVATLDFPSYLAIMTHARSEERRVGKACEARSEPQREKPD